MRPLTVQDVGRIVLVGGLLAVFVLGLIWAFNPDEEGGIGFSGAGSPEPTATPTEPEPAEPEATSTPEPTPEPTDTGPSPEELIEAAPDPGDTTVQILDAGGGGTRAQDAAEALRDLGYQVVNVTSARASVSSTTIWFNDEDAALGLRAREERVAEVAPNEALSTGVDLHLLVGPDWSS